MLFYSSPKEAPTLTPILPYIPPQRENIVKQTILQLFDLSTPTIQILQTWVKDRHKMQSLLYLHGSFGFPLCISGITNHLASSMECRIADHDHRREAMKKQRSQAREAFVANGEMGIQRSLREDLGKIKEGVSAEDLNDLFCNYKGCIAKAA